MCQFFLVIALETALHSLWLCGLPEDISPLSTNGSYGNANALVPQCPRERRGTRQALKDEVWQSGDAVHYFMSPEGLTLCTGMVITGQSQV
jgi:hypothetical protein